MILHIAKDSLLHAIDALTRWVVPRKPPLPVLTRVLLHDGQLAATNLDVRIHCRIDSLPAQHPPFLLPAAELRSWLRSLDRGSRLEIQPDPAFTTVVLRGLHQGQRVERTCSVPPPEDFPPPLPADTFSTQAQPQILDAERHDIRRALTFASTDPTRVFLNAVALFCRDARLRQWQIVATDGHRLFASRVHRWLWLQPGAAAEDGEEWRYNAVLLPPGTWLWASEFFAAPWRLWVNRAGSRARIETGPWQIDTKLVEGNFPNYQQVIPREEAGFAYRWQLLPDEATSAISTIGALPKHPKTGAVSILGSPEHLQVAAPDPSGGREVVMPLPGRWTGPDHFRAGFNRDYLRDVLLAGGAVVRLHDEVTPMWATTGDAATIVVMPVRLAA